MSTETYCTHPFCTRCLRARLEEIREWCRRNDYADYIYQPYIPLQISQVVFDERREEERDRLLRDQEG